MFHPENSAHPQAISLLQRRGQTADIAAALALIETYWNKDAVTTRAAATPAVTNAASKPKASAQPNANSLTPGHGAQFFIRHKGSIVRVLDVSEGSPQSGTPVIAYSRKPVTDPA